MARLFRINSMHERINNIETAIVVSTIDRGYNSGRAYHILPKSHAESAALLSDLTALTASARRRTESSDRSMVQTTIRDFMCSRAMSALTGFLLFAVTCSSSFSDYRPPLQRILSPFRIECMCNFRSDLRAHLTNQNFAFSVAGAEYGVNSFTPLNGTATGPVFHASAFFVRIQASIKYVALAARAKSKVLSECESRALIRGNPVSPLQLALPVLVSIQGMHFI